MAETLLIGSGNRKKAEELAHLLEGLPWEVKGLRDFPSVPEPEETGATFEENALLKAEYYSRAFGVACLADDSGLVVDALDGAPGVYSARYAGADANDARNNEKLLDALEEVPWPDRTAHFACCAALVRPGQPPRVEWGRVYGHISVEAFGENGFGYDVVFVPEGHDITFGEMDTAEKHKISHRGEALGKMRAFLERLACTP